MCPPRLRGPARLRVGAGRAHPTALPSREAKVQTERVTLNSTGVSEWDGHPGGDLTGRTE